MQGAHPSESTLTPGIFLVGFMGSGKTHWGKIWSDHYHLDFYDLDTVIEEAEGMTVKDIFTIKSESYFRSAETMALHSFASRNNFILACGGGTPCFNDNIQWMNEHGVTIFLNPAITTIANRLEKETAGRPLIKGLNQTELGLYTHQKIEERKAFYMQAKLILSEEKINMQSLDSLLLKK